MKQEVKLNKAEQAVIDRLPTEHRSSVTEKILTEKRASMAIRDKNRTDFSVTVNANGVLVIRGLGNRFPLGLRPDMWKTLIANAEKINQVVATIPPKA